MSEVNQSQAVTPEQIKQWKAEHGDIYKLSGEIQDDKDSFVLHTFYFKKPGRVQLSRFAKEAMSDALKAQNNLIFDCRLYPDETVIRELFEKQPGLIMSLGAELVKIVGMNQDFLSEKL